jgi:hypothetical protein
VNGMLEPPTEEAQYSSNYGGIKSENRFDARRHDKSAGKGKRYDGGDKTGLEIAGKRLFKISGNCLFCLHYIKPADLKSKFD